MKIYIGIQARMNSSRLPGKVLKNINGIPLIEYLLKRLRYLPNSYEIFILTSNNKTDDPVTFHFSKKEMSDLNKTGKVVQTDDKGVERVFISVLR